ncbi:MAG: hypothetical protein AAGJ84_09255 [Pseudomonadota bacterium]
MSLETIYYIGQTIAVVAIIMSLIFVGIQLQMGRKQAEEAERVARGQVVQHLAAEHRQHSLAMLLYPEVYRYFVGGADQSEMTDSERSRFFTYCFATLHMTQNIFFQHRNGLLDEKTFESYMPMLVAFMSSPAARLYWETRRGTSFDIDFVEMMEERFARSDSLNFPSQKASSNQSNSDAATG